MEPLSKNASERLELYERELRENLKGLAPVERDEAVRELRAHVLEAVEAGRQAGKSDDEVIEHVLRGFGNPSDYASEYVPIGKSEPSELGVLDRVILFSVKGAAKLWVAFILGLIYFGIFAFAYLMSGVGVFGGVVTIIYYSNLFPQFFGSSFSIGVPEFIGFLLIPMGIAGFYLTTRLLIKVIRFHYYYRSSPRKLFAYLKESRGTKRWTAWRIIDIAAVLTILVAFAIGMITQSQFEVVEAGEARRIEPITKESHIARLSAKEADIRLKLFGTIDINTDVTTGSIPPAELVKFTSTYNYDILRPVLEVKRHNQKADVLYVPRGFGKRPGIDISFPHSFPDMQANALKDNKHNILLSPAVVWNLSLESLGGDADINLSGLKIKDLNLDLLSGDKKVIRFSGAGGGQGQRESLASASIENMHGALDIDFRGLGNENPSRIDIDAYTSPLVLRSVGDADPKELDVNCFSSDANIYFNGNWSNGVKQITLDAFSGDMVIYIPKDVAAKFSIENFAGNTELFDIKFEGGVEYKTPGFDTAEKKLDIRIKAHSGDVRIHYAKP
ncbi:MAG TPA: LiaF domain-containing protein [Anaerolineae bacterium]|jgi:uncharacterized membrane protein|nr:LiaF domain-containing protein [Anaerolineae bacterium]